MYPCVTVLGQPNPQLPLAQCCRNPYHWTVLRRPLRAAVPSIILCVKMRDRRAPQRRGSPHSGEGKNGRSLLITTEWRGYKKILLVEFQDIYNPDLQNLFRPNRVILRGVLPLGTQIPRGTWEF